MTDPVTVFMLVVAGLLVVGTFGEQVFARTGVPSVIWLVALGVLVRVADIVPAPVIHMLAPFFAALALVIILFDAGTNLTGGTGEAALAATTRRRAQLLAFIGFAVTVVVVALFSHGLAALGILKYWGWSNALMLGSLIACGASEVALPSLRGWPRVEETTALLRRESAITKALAVTGTVICLDLLSPRVGEGGAGLAMAAGFGFALAFGGVAGMAWVVALQRLAGVVHDGSEPDARNYGFTLAVMVVLHVLSEAAGGSGPLSVLVFGAVLGNAGGVARMLGRVDEAGESMAGTAVQAALGGHARTISFVRTLLFAMVGLTLAPPWGPLVMGVVLALLVLVVRLAVGRFTLGAIDHHERSIIGACAPRGMATVALVTLALAHEVPGANEMVTLVFSAVTTSVLLFTLGLHGLRGPMRVEAVPVARAPARSPGSQVAAEVVASRANSSDSLTSLNSMNVAGSASGLNVPVQAVPPVQAVVPVEPVEPVELVEPVAAASGSGSLVASGPDLAFAAETSRRSGPVPTAQSMQAELSPRPGSETPARHSRPLQSARGSGAAPVARHGDGRISGPVAAARISGPVAAARPGEGRISGPVAAARSSEAMAAARSSDQLSRVAPPEPVRDESVPDARAPTMPREMSGPQPAASAGNREVDAPRLPEPEGYLPTLLNIEGAQPAEDPLAGAMARALAKRPAEVTTARRRPTGDYVVPPTFTPFPDTSEEDALSLLAGLGMRDGAGPKPPRTP